MHQNNLEQTIKSHIEKSHNLQGNPETELTLWFDLIKKIICLDQRARLTAQQALEHPFFAKDQEPAACANSELLPAELLKSGNDFHEFITKAERNKKKDFKKVFTFKHNLPIELAQSNNISSLVNPVLKPTSEYKNPDFMVLTRQ